MLATHTCPKEAATEFLYLKGASSLLKWEGKIHMPRLLKCMLRMSLLL